MQMGSSKNSETFNEISRLLGYNETDREENQQHDRMKAILDDINNLSVKAYDSDFKFSMTNLLVVNEVKGQLDLEQSD